MLAVLWDDFDLRAINGAGACYVELRGNPGSQRFIISWEDCPQYNLGGVGVDANNFQIVLFEDGRIEYRYGTINGDFTINTDTSVANGGATVGVEDPTGGSASSQYGFGASPVSSNTNIAVTLIDNNPCDTECLADFNGDTFINPDDLADFITCFFLDVQFPGFCPEADFNGDGFRDPDDLADFITTFFLAVQFGC